MNDKHIDELIDRALQEEAQLPEGLSDRLEQYVDQLAAGDRQTHAKRIRLRILYGLTGVAAALLIGIAVFFQPATDSRPTTADTFQSPEEAAVAAQEVLAFLSTQFNKGLDQVSEARGEVEKVNGIVNKQIKEVNTP